LLLKLWVIFNGQLLPNSYLICLGIAAQRLFTATQLKDAKMAVVTRVLLQLHVETAVAVRIMAAQYATPMVASVAVVQPMDSAV
jgi:hypothetical protein